MDENKNGSKSLRVFLSYGRDEHVPMAYRLKEDLKKKGHKVCFDADILKTGVDWEKYIEDALAWVSEDPEIGRIVLVMTPHSVRRRDPDISDSEDGYCLNEIHRALQNSLDIIPVMLVWCEPPLSICRVQWLDMMDCIPLEEKEPKYEEKFNLLLEALEEGEVTHGFQTSLKTVLDPIEFDVDILKHVERFTGRKWVFDRIDEWIKNPNKSRIFWISGEPGTGKTAIASWFCEKRRQAAAFHLCQHNDTIRSDPRRCIMSLAYQLSTQIPDYYELLKSMELKKIEKELNATTLFRELISKPLSKIPKPPDVPFIILIDALDEATDDGKNELASFISKYFNESPEWLRLIITSRPEPEVNVWLQGVNPYILNTELPENLKDIQEYLKKELKKYSPEGKVNPIVVDKILDKSEGNFLYVELIRSELEEGNLTIENVDKFPQGLGSIYFDFFNRKFPDINYYLEKIAPALDIISAAQEPLEIGFISSVMDWTDREKLQFQRKTASLFSTRNKKIQAFHKSLIDWLTNPEKAGDYYVSKVDGHKKLTQIGWENYQKGAKNLSPYMLSYLPVHLIRSSLWDEIHEILTDLEYIEVKCAAGMTYNLIEDYNLALDALPEAQEEKHGKIEHEKRVEKYTPDLIAYAKGEIDHLDIIPSVKPWTKEEIKKDKDRIVINPNRLDLIKAFYQFVNSQSSDLVEFGSIHGFCLQQAYNFADSGPVTETAKKNINENNTEKLFLREKNCRPEFNPHPSHITTLEGHTNWVMSVAVTPDGRKAISGSLDLTIKVWDLDTGELLKTLKGHSKGVYAVAMTVDGRKAISGSYDNTLKVWDLDTGELLKTLKGHSKGVNAVAVTPDGKKAISGGSDNTARLWDLDTGELLKTLKGCPPGYYSNSVYISPNGKKAIIGSFNGNIGVWDLDKDELLKTLKHNNKNMVCSVALTPDGKIAISGSEDNTIKVWDLDTGELLKTLKGRSVGVNSVALTPDGKIAISGSNDKIIRVWDVERGKILKELTGHVLFANSVAITADGKKAISDSGDNTISVWDLEMGKSSINIPEYFNRVLKVVITPDSKKAIIRSGDNTIKVWDMGTGELLKTLKDHNKEVNSVVVTPDSKIAISGSNDSTIKVWDVERVELLKTLIGHTYPVLSVALTPDGKIAISGCMDSTIKVWDLDTGKILKTLKGHKKAVVSLAVTPDGKKVISGSNDENVCVWDLERYKLIKKLKGQNENLLIIPPNGKRVISRKKFDNTIKIWDLDTGELLKTLKVPNYVHYMAVTPDGKKVISGIGPSSVGLEDESPDSFVFIWDLDTGKLLKTLKGHKGSVSNVSMTTNGNMIISVGLDRNVMVWDLKTGKLVCASKLESMIHTVAITSDYRFVFGCENGDVIFYHLINMDFVYPLITAFRIWLFRKNVGIGHWDDNIKADCKWCGYRFKVADEILYTIREIENQYKKPNGWIANEAWNDSRLLSECPSCHKKLKFNPFIVDNRDNKTNKQE